MTNVNLDAHAQWCGWKATGMNYEHAQCAMVIFSIYPDSPSAVWCWRGRAVKKLLCQSFVVVVLAILSQTASAADSSSPYTKVPATVQQKNQDLGWSGFYVGAEAGISSGYSPWTATQPGGAPNLAGSLQMFRPIDPWTEFGSHFGGLTTGYNFRLSPRWIVGIEADASFPSLLQASQTFSSSVIGAANYQDKVDAFGTLRGRFGYDVNHWMYYVTGGFAWAYNSFTRTQYGAGPTFGAAPGTVETAFGWRLGWTAGAGFEAPIGGGWTGKVEYLYSQYGNTAAGFPLGAQTFNSSLSTHQVRAGLNYQLGNAALDLTKPMPPALDLGDWAVHGQTTYVNQYAPPFHAPYRGANSLDPNAGRETWDVTLYIGRRLWDGAELWINPEIDQGFGLSNTLGLAGFSSGEAYKVGNSYPYLRIPRAFIRQTIDLGGDTQKLEADINQFAGTQTADRIVITAGKFSVVDVFDTTRYAHDPRSDFLNWTVVNAGTFDYAANSWGFSYGAAAEWYHGDWALRGGVFDLSVVPNSDELDPTFHQYQLVYELEHRHQLFGQPGKVAVNGFLSRGRMGTFADAIALAEQTGTIPTTTDVRAYRSRTGVNLNFEQQIRPDVGIFGRFGWANGNIEPYEFTDVDRTASLGLSIDGHLWGRDDDTFGLAGVANGISAIHQAYLNDGGLGILVGDGQLPHPGPEKILETYYRFPLGGWQLTADYQFIANPAYNRDRGPVSVITGRLRTQF